MLRFAIATILFSFLWPHPQVWASDLRPEEQQQIVGKVKSITYYVENFDRLAVANNERPTKSLNFDNNGRLVESFSGRDPRRTTYHYDENGKLKSLIVYDVKGGVMRTAKVEYDDKHNVETRRYYQGGREVVIDRYSYNSNVRVRESERRFQSPDFVSERNVEFFYDQDGKLDRSHIEKKREYIGKNPDFRRMLKNNNEWFLHYSYDKYKNLKNVIVRNSRGNISERQVFRVDQRGNWVEKVTYTIDQSTQREKKKSIVRRKIAY